MQAAGRAGVRDGLHAPARPLQGRLGTCASAAQLCLPACLCVLCFVVFCLRLRM